MLKGIISTFNNKSTILTKIITKIQIHTELPKNNAQNIKHVRNKIDSLSHRYGVE
jgi:hypothetical protein